MRFRFLAFASLSPSLNTALFLSLSLSILLYMSQTTLSLSSILRSTNLSISTHLFFKFFSLSCLYFYICLKTTLSLSFILPPISLSLSYFSLPIWTQLCFDHSLFLSILLSASPNNSTYRWLLSFNFPPSLFLCLHYYICLKTTLSPSVLLSLCLVFFLSLYITHQPPLFLIPALFLSLNSILSPSLSLTNFPLSCSLTLQLSTFLFLTLLRSWT